MNPAKAPAMDERTIESFWDANPCGDSLVGGLADTFANNYEEFFRAYDSWRYAQEAHILRALDGLDLSGKRVLEIGLGQGADSEQLIRRGARWSGVDITAAAVDRVRTRLSVRELPFDDLRRGTVLDLPWPDASFDVVFSHGVLHHVPDIARAQREIRRVLRPDGELVVMLYARRSLNFQVSIRVLRRLALLAVYPAFRAGLLHPGGIIGQHLVNARDRGILRYLRLAEFTHHNTDGPLNPYAKVYEVSDIERDFADFDIARTFKLYLHAPPLPMRRLRRLQPLERLLGWHLWAVLRPRHENGRADEAG